MASKFYLALFIVFFCTSAHSFSTKIETVGIAGKARSRADVWRLYCDYSAPLGAIFHASLSTSRQLGSTVTVQAIDHLGHAGGIAGYYPRYSVLRKVDDGFFYAVVTKANDIKHVGKMRYKLNATCTDDSGNEYEVVGEKVQDQ